MGILNRLWPDPKRVIVAILGLVLLVVGSYGLFLFYDVRKLENIGGFGGLVEIGAILVVLSLFRYGGRVEE